MNDLDLLLLGGVLGLLVVVFRPQTVVLPTIATPPSERFGVGGFLLPLVLGLLLLGLLLFGGKPV